MLLDYQLALSPQVRENPLLLGGLNVEEFRESLRMIAINNQKVVLIKG